MSKQEPVTVLVIEDDVDISGFVCRVLELDGYQVLRADDAAAGLEVAGEAGVSLIVLNLRPPRHDGWHFLEQREGDPVLSAIPTIVFTASAGISEREKAVRMGVTEYLVKPLSAERLRASVRRITQSRR